MIGKKLILSLSLAAMLLAGCGSGATSTVVLTPRFPTPSLEALDALEKLDNPAVNQWIVQLSKLCQKLEEEC